MRIQDQLAPLVHQAILTALQEGDLPAFDVPGVEDVPIERPKSEEHGDFASPVAMQLARLARRAPRQIAETLARHLPTGPDDVLASVEVAGAGFLNVRLSPPWLARHVDAVLAAGSSYANPSIGAGKTAQVEFISANPTGPLTVGHGRGAVIGDTLARLLAADGWQVEREYYFNNAGRQMRVLAESVRARYLELIGHAADFPEDGYQGEYIRDVARGLVERHGAALATDDGTAFRAAAEQSIFAAIRATQERLGVTFDRYFDEDSL